MPRRNPSGIELLADPTRRRIIALLATRSLRPSTIAREIGLSRPAVSRQLRLLRQNGLVERRRSFVDGRSLVYQIPPGQLGPIAAWLAGTSVGRPLAGEFDSRGLPLPG
jgi:DNA-binding transcriptional ArsR family regulator